MKPSGTYTPLTLTLTSKETDQVYAALGLALSVFKDIGHQGEIAKIQAAFDMIGDHERVGGFKTQAERDAAYMKSGVEEMRRYGHD